MSQCHVGSREDNCMVALRMAHGHRSHCPPEKKALGDSFRLQNPNVGDLSALKN
jgi:hypothetical protein